MSAKFCKKHNIYYAPTDKCVHCHVEHLEGTIELLEEEIRKRDTHVKVPGEVRENQVAPRNSLGR